ncbi:MAG: IMP cyclohydrolase [Christensenellaceae bacterium]|jgi:IMP cyclohydrolase|nr:IMP cyclohydrolase [Christensenellaceae bacterium]
MCAQQLKTILEQGGYVGRGVLLGLSPGAKCAAMAYFIMGRSANSQNRRFVRQGDGICIQAVDAAAVVGNPSLVFYTPVRRVGPHTIVTNGDQTDTIYAALLRGDTFEDALRTRRFEPDAPHFTPRISGLLTVTGGALTYTLSILKSADVQGRACLRQFFEYEPRMGLGHLLHTYRGDGDPLPAFAGEPAEVELPPTAQELAALLWQSLHPAYKVSLFVRYADLATGGEQSRIYNQHE